MARVFAARCAAEADAVDLDETHHRHGAGHRQHHYRERRNDGSAEFGHGKQGLIDKPLADKAVERWQRRDNHGTDQERQRGQGHQLGEAPILSMSRVCRRNITEPVPIKSRLLKMAWLSR